MPAKAIEKNKKLSATYPTEDEFKGATYHLLFLSLSNIWTSSNWAIKKAEPEAIAILNYIKSVKLVVKNKVNVIPIRKPI